VTTTTRSREAEDYLGRVAAALADLPDDDRRDVLEEVAGHVDEVAGESEAPLVARLGSPEDYAAELRASAGLPAAERGTGPLVRERLRQLRERPAVRAARDFLGSLRPAWWVLRAWVLVGLVAMWPGQTTPTWGDAMPLVPRVGTPLVGLLVLLAVVVASVQVGRRDRSLSAGQQLAVRVVNLGAALMLLPVMASVGAAGHPDYVYVDSEPVTVVPHEGVYSAGEQVWNIYAYDAAGTMLHDVRLFTQDGTPLSLGLSFDATKRQTLDSSGQRVDNAFPYRYLDPGSGVVEDETAGPPVDAPPLLGVPTPTAGGGQPPSPSATRSSR
jgi:hypothetical protein